METAKKVGKIILVVLIILFLGWLSFFRLNIGKLIVSLLGRRKQGKKPIVMGPDDKIVGESAEIIDNHNPLRDKSKLRLENGTVIDLPKGIQDIDIEKVIVEGVEVYEIKIKPNRMSSLFDVLDSDS